MGNDLFHKGLFQQLFGDFIWNFEKEEGDDSQDRYEFNNQMIKSFKRLLQEVERLDDRIKALEKK